MFQIGDRIYIREDLHINKEDLPNYLGVQGVVVNTREIEWSMTDTTILEVLLDGDSHPKEWYSRRFGYAHNKEPDWEV